MGHAAAIYAVKVERRRHKEELVQHGHIGEEGGALIWALSGYLKELATANDDDTKIVRCTSVDVDQERNELRGRITIGQKGQRVDHYDDAGERVFSQLPPHLAEVRAGFLFRMPPTSNVGFLALHVPDRKGIISLLRPPLQQRFREDFPNHRLELTPATEGTALQKAVDEERIDKLKLISRDVNSDAFQGDVEKWVVRGAPAEISLVISGRHGIRLISELIRRYLAGDTSAFGKIVEFHGMIFETAKVEADVDGGRKTFNIEKPEAGHAITVDLSAADLRTDAEGWITDESLFGALRAALPAVPGTS